MDMLLHSIRAAIWSVRTRNRREEGAWVRRDSLAMPFLGTTHRDQDPDAPAAAVHSAYRLARLGVPAAWIAASCELPEGFVLLITAEVADGPGPSFPPRSPEVSR